MSRHSLNPRSHAFPFRGMVAASDHLREHSSVALLGAAMAALVVASLFSSRVLGQDAGKLEEIPMHKALTPDVIKRVDQTTKTFISNGTGNPKMVTAYFGLYVPAIMTARSEEALLKMPEVVSDVSSYISRASRSNQPQVTQKIIKDAFAGLTKVAEGNYHAAGRISAIILLSQLDQRPADNAAKTPPVPLTWALPVLMKLYENEQNPDGVRAAALQGIRRHVLYSFPQIPADVRAKISKNMTALLDSEPPMFRTDKAHAYLQRYAVDILTVLRAGDDTSLGVKLVGISTAPKSPDLIALHSAARIGDLGKSMKGKVESPEKVLNSWSARALAAFESEIDRLNALERSKPTVSAPRDPKSFLQEPVVTPVMPMNGMDGMDEDYGMEEEMMGSMDDMSMYGMEDEMDMGYDEMAYGDMMGMGMGMLPQAKPQPPEVSASRRKLNYVLQQLQIGATGSASAGMPRNPGGLLASVADDKKAAVQAWVESMKTIVEALNDEMLDDRTKYLEGLQSQVEAFKALIGEPETPIFSDEDDVAAAPKDAPSTIEDALTGVDDGI